MCAQLPTSLRHLRLTHSLQILCHSVRFAPAMCSTGTYTYLISVLHVLGIPRWDADDAFGSRHGFGS